VEQTELWAAPYAGGPVRAVVDVPGSKSMTNRALVCAALADGTSEIRRPLQGRDSALMRAGLTALGARVVDLVGGALAVTGRPPPLVAPGDPIDVGLAGTVARFLPPVAALATGEVRFVGDRKMSERPLRPLLQALRDVGASIDDEGRGSVPLTVNGRGRLAGGPVKIDATESSQLVSGLLLAAPYFDTGIDVHSVGELPSAPHVAMTVAMMRRAGADVDAEPGRWRVPPGRYRPADMDIEPDVAGASYFLAAAVITAGSVTVRGWPRDGVQPSERWLEVLREMGATTAYDDSGLTINGPGVIAPVDVDLHEISEIAPTVAVLAAVASGPSRIRGIAHVRGHETDRLAALATELGRVGADVRETADGLQIRPRPLRADVWRTYADHRMAMSGAVLGLVVRDLRIEDIACTGKTIPDFADRWRAMVSPS
jgi:3-phosphoshikimate 1-carboxyvinyltransferase